MTIRNLSRSKTVLSLGLLLGATAAWAGDSIELPRPFPIDTPVYDLEARQVELARHLGQKATVVYMLSQDDLYQLADDLKQERAEETPLSALHAALRRSVALHADAGVSWILLVETAPVARPRADFLAEGSLDQQEEALVRRREAAIRQVARTLQECEGLNRFEAVVDVGGLIASRLGLSAEHEPALLIVNARRLVCYYDAAGDEDGPATKLDPALRSELRAPGSLPASAPR